MSEANNKGCGCANIPISVILLLLGGGFWAYKKYSLPDINVSQINNVLDKVPGIEIQIPEPEPLAQPTPTPTLPPVSIVDSPQLPTTKNEPEADLDSKLKEIPVTQPLPKTDWEKKQIRGIYLSRYQITNNASEQMIRDPKAMRSVIALNTTKPKASILLFMACGAMPARCITAQ